MKNWILTIGIDKFYLTEKEKVFYLESIDKGAKYISIGDKILGTTFQTLINKSVIEETKALNEGKKQCEYGKWHDKNASCFCGTRWIMSIDGVAREVPHNYELSEGEKELK